VPTASGLGARRAAAISGALVVERITAAVSARIRPPMPLQTSHSILIPIPTELARACSLLQLVQPWPWPWGRSSYSGPGGAAVQTPRRITSAGDLAQLVGGASSTGVRTRIEAAAGPGFAGGLGVDGADGERERRSAVSRERSRREAQFDPRWLAAWPCASAGRCGPSSASRDGRACKLVRGIWAGATSASPAHARLGGRPGALGLAWCLSWAQLGFAWRP